METFVEKRSKTLATHPRVEKFQVRLCWQAHDDYYECMSKQLEKDESKYTIIKII
jgi:hypothetical protein